MSSRFRLWGMQHGVTEDDAKGRYCRVSDRIPVLNATSAVVLRKLLEKIVADEGDAPGLIVIDTLSQALDGDENDSSTTAPVLRALALLRDEFDCTILILHHIVKVSPSFGRGRKGEEKWIPLTLNQIRGSGAITRNIDAVLGIQTSQADSGIFELVVLKQKDGRIGKPVRFRRDAFQTDRYDEDGQPETSCILIQEDDAQVHKEDSEEVRETKQELLREKNRVKAIKSMIEAVRKEGKFTNKDALCNYVKGASKESLRGYLSIALTRGDLVNVGTDTKVVICLPEAADRIRDELIEAKEAAKDRARLLRKQRQEAKKSKVEDPPITPQSDGASCDDRQEKTPDTEKAPGANTDDEAKGDDRSYAGADHEDGGLAGEVK